MAVGKALGRDFLDQVLEEDDAHLVVVVDGEEDLAVDGAVAVAHPVDHRLLELLQQLQRQPPLVHPALHRLIQ